LATLLVASTGGHLKELHHLRDRLTGVSRPFRWVTFDTPQSRSMLDTERVDFVPFVDSRDVFNLMRTLPAARQIVKDPSLDAIVTTGAAVALPFVTLGRTRGVDCHYIESAARADGPSITGRMLRNVPGVNLYAQHRRWAGGRWGYGGSVFDSFEPASDAGRVEDTQIAKVVVTVGTCQHDFGRLLRRLLDLLPAAAEVLWQTGTTDTSGMPISAHHTIPEHELTAAMREADVIVSHAGIGSAMAALELGKRPVLVPRRVRLSEQIDDHQTEIARELGKRGLSVSVEADEVTFADLLSAARRGVTRRAQTPPFPLNGTDRSRGIAIAWGRNSSKVA
jgi:UDP-N-acetylglucosamine--N-acetylmuramyl-(pentapeptide) pyrophosphoryl-undecaprenol N-acetylglucosamine transferase